MSVFAVKSMIFLAVQLLISNSVISAQVLLHKPLDETISINCTGCNSSSCLININNVDLHYNVSDNGMLTLPPNDLTVYGTIICNGSNEQKEYLICPPNIGMYITWVQIISSATTITVGDTVEISAIFLHLPHNGITILINDSVFDDYDSPMSCTAKNSVLNKIVNYSCIARQPGIKNIEAQLEFCDIPFNSSILINIVPISSSTAVNANMTTSSTMSSNIMVSSSIVPSSTMATTNSSLATDDNGLTPGETAAIVVPVFFVAVLLLITIAAIMTCIYFKYLRLIPTSTIITNNNIMNTLFTCGPPGDGHVSTNNVANNGHLSTGNGTIPTNGESDPSNANGNLTIISPDNEDVSTNNAEASTENNYTTANAYIVPQQVTDMHPGVINNPVPMLAKTFDHRGGELIIEDHGITIAVPELAVSEGDEVDIRACASLTGPYMLPDGYELVSVFVCIEADYVFNKLVRVTMPHFAAIENLDQSFNVVVLTANKNDIVYNEYGDFVLQMHKSVYDYQYEVNDGYCVYYTNHFCSKCLARRSLIFRLFKGLTPAAPRGAAFYNRTKITVFFCVPDDYASANDLLIELCFCYSLKYCLQTVHKSYKQRKMLSLKSIIVSWTFPIDDQKSQNFCLSWVDCPGWKIEPFGSEKIKVSDLEFHSGYTVEDLRAQEELCLYPPRFKISVVRLSHGKKLQLDTMFKITLENDGIPVLDEIKKFPLIVAELEKNGLSKQQYTTDVDSSITSTATNTATTTVTTNNSPPVLDILPSSSYHSATGSISSSSAIGSVSASAASTPLATDGALVTTSSDLDQATLSSHFPVSSTAAGSTIVNSMHMGLIVQGGINFYQSKESHQIVENNGGSFNSLECFSTAITESVDLGTILPNLISHGLLTPNQREHLTHPLRTSAETKQELCGILLSLDERCVKKFLQCLSETSDYNPHKQLLNKIQTKVKEATEEVN